MDSPAKNSPRRRWGRFSLRTLLIVTAAFGIWLGLTMAAARRQQAAVNAILEAGGTVVFDYEANLPPNGQYGNNPGAVLPGPAWLRNIASDDYFRTPVTVMLLDASKTTGELIEQHVASLSHLQILQIKGDRVTDKSLEAIGRLKQLQELALVCPNLTADGLRQLQNLPALTSFIGLRDLGNEKIAVDLSRQIGGIAGFKNNSVRGVVEMFEWMKSPVKLRIDPQVTTDFPVNDADFTKKPLRKSLQELFKDTEVGFIVDRGDILIVPAQAAKQGWLGYETMQSQFPNLTQLIMDW